MTRYACREDNGQLKLPPAGSNVRRAFCGECLNRPYKGENCLFGHSPETRYLIKRVASQLRYEAELVWARRHGRMCALCGEPLRNSWQHEMHIACWHKVWKMERDCKKEGREVTRQEAIQRLIATGNVEPQYPMLVLT